jgi:hypothetical protein
MNRACLIAGVLLGCVAVPAVQAQQYLPPQVSPYGNQVYSPYINLLRNSNGRGNPAVNYMGIVQPQMEAQTTFQQLQGQITTGRQTLPGVAPPRNNGVTDTGYSAARFMQYNQYFLSLPNGRGTNAGSNRTGTSIGGLGAAGLNLGGMNMPPYRR